MHAKEVSPNTIIREYLIVISPPPKIKKGVQKFKNEYLNYFGTAEYIHSIAHISLSHFLTESTPERTIVSELELLLGNWKSFNIDISGFGYFQGAESSTLFLRSESQEIVRLQWYMVAILRKRAKIANRFAKKLREPHITIAAKIPNTRFDKVWQHFGKRSYITQFSLNKITILRRTFSIPDENYKIAGEIYLKTEKE